MADQKISQLTDGGNAQAADEFVVARSGSNFRIDGASVAAAATSVGTLTSLTVSGDLTVDTSTLKVDSTNNRVGIGTATPGWDVDVARSSTSGSGGGYPGIRIRNTNTSTLSVSEYQTQAENGTVNASFASIYDSSDLTTPRFTRIGTLTNHPLTFYTNSTEKMRLDASGNLGLGVTPSAWTFTGVTALQIKNAGFWGYQNRANVTANGFVNNTGAYSYISNGFATTYEQNSGKHVWYTAASGTAGNTISFTQAMTLDASGNLLVGTTTSTNNLRLNQRMALVTAGSGTFAGMAITNYSGTDATARPLIDINRSRGTTDGSMTKVESGDQLGTFLFRGSDGTAFRDAASIGCFVDGATGASDMPGRLVFSTTADGSVTLTERARIPAAGGLQVVGAVSVGNATPVTSGAGITFPATQSASSDANTLDDYEEGTFDPTAYGATTAGTTTYTSRRGFYTKIGNQVTVTIWLNYSALTGTGDLTIGGLPFTVGDVGGFGQSYTIGAVLPALLNWTGGTSIVCFGTINTATILLWGITDDAGGTIQQCVDESANMRMTLTYFVA